MIMCSSSHQVKLIFYKLRKLIAGYLLAMQWIWTSCFHFHGLRSVPGLELSYHKLCDLAKKKKKTVLANITAFHNNHYFVT